VLKWAASVEQRSEHPLALAVTKAARDRQVEVLPVEKFAAMEGGACAAPWTGASSR